MKEVSADCVWQQMLELVHAATMSSCVVHSITLPVSSVWWIFHTGVLVCLPLSQQDLLPKRLASCCQRSLFRIDSMDWLPSVAIASARYSRCCLCHVSSNFFFFAFQYSFHSSCKARTTSSSDRLRPSYQPVLCSSHLMVVRLLSWPCFRFRRRLHS